MRWGLKSRAEGRTVSTGRAVYAGVLLLFALAVASYFVYQVGQVVLALLLTLLFAVILSRPVDYLSQKGLTRGWATAVVVGTAVLVLSIAGVLMAPVVDGFVALFPAGRRAEVRRVLGEVYDAVRRWLLGQLVAMTFIGLLSTLALTLLGIPFAVLLGLFSGLISFVPFVGAVVSVIPPVLLALASDPIVALWVIAAYTLIQQLESQIIQPVVMSRAVALHPAVVLFAILALGTLFGVVGFLLAVPLVATLQVLVRELWVRRMDGVGEDQDPPQRGSEAAKPGLLRRTLVGARRLVSRLR